jgi:toxin YoeB
MTYRLNILKNAKKDLDWFRQHDRTSYIKCFDFVREVMETPRTGTGKPERLKYFEKEVYSRRINLKDRMIYTIYEDIKEIDISSFRGHYDTWHDSL